MSRRIRQLVVAVALIAVVPALASGQTLTELGATNAARNEMMSNGGEPPANAPQPAPAPAGPVALPSANTMKYTLSYALVGMLIGLGMYLVCRPSHRHVVE